MKQLMPGARIENSRKSKCGTCSTDVLLGQVRDEVQTLKWRNFDLPAIENGDGHRFYRRHFCPNKTIEREQKYSGRLVGAR